ncbi:MAG: hypothetical protein ACKV2T_29285 [Kofleriaceae bacterium]
MLSAQHALVATSVPSTRFDAAAGFAATPAEHPVQKSTRVPCEPLGLEDCQHASVVLHHLILIVDGPLVFMRGTPLAFTEAEAKLDQFESLLLQHGIAIPCGSKLEEIFLSIKKYLSLNRREMVLPPTTDLRDEWVRMLGLVDLAYKVIGANETKWFPKLVPHFKLLARAADPSQNAPTDHADQANHKLFELLIGAASASFADDLIVEPPDANETKTPDVTASWLGQRWGIACKVLQSDKPARYRDQIRKGISQIDRCDVDRGLVLINVKNLIPFETFLPFGRKSQTEPYEIFEKDDWTEHIDAFRRALRSRVDAEHDDIVDAFRGSPIAGRTALVCHYAQCMAWVRREGEARMTPFVLLDPVFFSMFRVERQTHRFLRQLTSALAWGSAQHDALAS